MMAEVLLATVRPSQLLAGKVVGIGIAHLCPRARAWRDAPELEGRAALAGGLNCRQC